MLKKMWALAAVGMLLTGTAVGCAESEGGGGGEGPVLEDRDRDGTADTIRPGDMNERETNDPIGPAGE